MSLYLSPGWTHFFLGIPLSPRAKKSIHLLLHQLQYSEHQFNALTTPLLHITIEDLGICPEANEDALKIALRRGSAQHTSFKLTPKKWIVETYDERQFLWLELKDRFRQFEYLHKDIHKELSRYHFEFEESYEPPRILCGFLKGRKINRIPDIPSTPFWVNEINLYQRPKVYSPRRGYDYVWSIQLPLEQPLTESEPVHLDHQNEEILQRLEARLEERKQQKIQPSRPRRRRKRRQSKEKV